MTTVTTDTKTQTQTKKALAKDKALVKARALIAAAEEQEAEQSAADATVARMKAVQDAAQKARPVDGQDKLDKRSVTCLLLITEGEDVTESITKPDGSIDEVEGHFMKGTFSMSTITDLEFSWFWNTARFNMPCLAIAKSDKFRDTLKAAINRRLRTCFRRTLKAKGGFTGLEVDHCYRIVVDEIDTYQKAESID